MTIPSLNNLLVDNLLKGDRKSIESLSVFVGNPFFKLARVNSQPNLYGNGVQENVQEETLLYWVHQARSEEAADYCWDTWLFKKIGASKGQQQVQLIVDIANEAFLSGLNSGSSKPLLRSWENLYTCIGVANEMWSEKSMLNVFFTKICDSLTTHANPVPILSVLSDLYQEGYFTSPIARSWIEEQKIIDLFAIPESMKIAEFILELPSSLEDRTLVGLSNHIQSQCVSLMNVMNSTSSWDLNVLNQKLSQGLNYHTYFKQRIPGHELSEDFLNASSKIRFNAGLSVENRDALLHCVLKEKIVSVPEREGPRLRSFNPSERF